MKLKAITIIPLLCISFLFTTLCPPSQADALAARSENPEASEASLDKKKAQPRKRKKKAATVKTESEYKFTVTDRTHYYRFDKNGDPVLKREKHEDAKTKGKKSRGSKRSKAAAQPAIPEMKAPVKPRGARYVCPMGDYEGDKPGECPKCGMTLVEKK